MRRPSVTRRAPFEPARTRWDDPCLGFFTSGTTAQPKLVLHQHAWPPAFEGHGRFVLDAGPADLLWLPADNGWAASAYLLFAPWTQGAAIFVQDVRGRADASQILGILEQYPITHFGAVPTLLRMLIAAGLDDFTPRALRVTVSGGEAVNPEIIDAWQAATGIDHPRGVWTVRDRAARRERAAAAAAPRLDGPADAGPAGRDRR